MNIDKLKGIIEKTVKETGATHQSIYDMYFFERFLYRLSISNYKDKFVFKGGFLLEKIVGLSQRTTLDIDLKAVKVDMTDDEISSVFNEICNIKTDDGIVYTLNGIENITAETKYDGKSVKIIAKLQNLKKQFGIDIAKGDIVTPYPQKYLYKSDIEDFSFNILAYTKESIIAEKFETMIAKGTANSRSKDLFDMYLLMKGNVDIDKLNAALINTFTIRNTPFEKNDIILKIEQIYQSRYKKEIFNQYVKTHSFAKGISYEDVINSAKDIANLIQIDETILPKANIKVDLIRHGEDEQNVVGGWSDNKLTIKGKKEVEELTNKLDTDYDIIFSSDLIRAKETTQIIANSIKCDIVYDSNLREINNGIFKNMKIEEFLQNSNKKSFIDLKYDEKYQGGESPEDFYNRIKNWFIDFLQQYNNKKVLIVTHGGVITVIQCLLKKYKYSNMLKIDPPYASKTSINLEK